MDIYGMSTKVYEIATIITIIGSIVLITYSTVATVAYLTLSSRVKSNKAMDKLSRFTGQDAVVTNKGVTQVVGRLFATVILLSFLLSGGGFLLINIIYTFILRFTSAM